MKYFFNVSRNYFAYLLFLFVVFFFIKVLAYDFFFQIDEAISNFIQNNIVSDGLTSYFKFVTNFGGFFFFVLFLAVFYFIFRDREILAGMSINLAFVYFVSILYKNIFRRQRPLFTLIDKPKDFSFPSGHTMCSVAFYGLLIYIINKYVKNDNLKFGLNAVCVILIISIPLSRIYLNVHYFTDVVGGVLLGLVCLLMFINYDRIKGIV